MLGKRSEEKIRLVLLEKEEFSEDNFPIIGTLISFDGDFHEDIWTQADHIVFRENRVFRFVLNRLLVSIFENEIPVGKEYLSGTIKKDGTWTWIKKDVREIPF